RHLFQGQELGRSHGRRRPVDHRPEPGLVGPDSPRANRHAEPEGEIAGPLTSGRGHAARIVLRVSSKSGPRRGGFLGNALEKASPLTQGQGPRVADRDWFRLDQYALVHRPRASVRTRSLMKAATGSKHE